MTSSNAMKTRCSTLSKLSTKAPCVLWPTSLNSAHKVCGKAPRDSRSRRDCKAGYAQPDCPKVAPRNLRTRCGFLPAGPFPMGCSSTTLSLMNAGLDGLSLASLIGVSLTVGTVVGFGIRSACCWADKRCRRSHRLSWTLPHQPIHSSSSEPRITHQPMQALGRSPGQTGIRGSRRMESRQPKREARKLPIAFV